MAEDGIPEILAEQRLGHEVPGMRGLYAHASQRMRDELKQALQARWEDSLCERAAIHPHSPVPLLDELLAAHQELAKLSRREPISQISPNAATAPIRCVGWELSVEPLIWPYICGRYWDRTSDLLGVN